MAKIDFNLIRKQCVSIAESIKAEQDNLKTILIQYEAYNVAEYEIERCIRTLKSIDENRRHFIEKVDIISVFMPSNLPLYSLVISALIPGFMAEKLYIHPNSTLRKQGIIESIFHALQLGKHLPNVRITSDTSDVFIEKYVKNSKVIIFTGKGTTKAEIEKIMPNNSILIFNGSGHNPVVVGEDANIEKAVQDSIYVKFFNNGQDCGGPDSILVHKNVAKEFIEKFKEGCSKLTIGGFSSPDTFVGPIHEKSELERLENIISDNKDYLMYGGNVDFNNYIVYPTILVSKITENVNFKEIFGPIAFIVIYDEDEKLKLYFQDDNGRYQYNKMYVSLYGNSRYIKSNCDTTLLRDEVNSKNGVGIVLNNQIIHDVEIGTKAYGGYSKGASSVVYKNLRGEISRKAFPILIPEVITEILFKRRTAGDLQTQSFLMPGNILNSDSDLALHIEHEFKQQAKKTFGDNIEFAFIFGSVAKRTFIKNKSGVDTFICLKEADQPNTAAFIKWTVQYQYSLNLKPDLEYPSEIMTYKVLESAIEDLEDINISFSFSSSTVYDKIFWACVLPSFHKKRAFVGGEQGGRKLSRLANKCKSYPKRWAEGLTQLFNQSKHIPVSVQKYYKDLNKEEIKQKLVKLMEEHEYCEIMRLIDFNSTESTNHRKSCKAYITNGIHRVSLENMDCICKGVIN